MIVFPLFSSATLAPAGAASTLYSLRARASAPTFDPRFTSPDTSTRPRSTRLDTTEQRALARTRYTNLLVHTSPSLLFFTLPPPACPHEGVQLLSASLSWEVRVRMADPSLCAEVLPLFPSLRRSPRLFSPFYLRVDSASSWATSVARTRFVSYLASFERVVGCVSGCDGRRHPMDRSCTHAKRTKGRMGTPPFSS